VWPRRHDERYHGRAIPTSRLQGLDKLLDLPYLDILVGVSPVRHLHHHQHVTTYFLPPFLTSFHHRQFLFHRNSPGRKTISKIKRWFKDLLDLHPISSGSNQDREPCAWSVFQAAKRETSSLCVCVSHDSFYHRAASQLGFRRAGSVRVYPGVSGPMLITVHLWETRLTVWSGPGPRVHLTGPAVSSSSTYRSWALAPTLAPWLKSQNPFKLFPNTYYKYPMLSLNQGLWVQI
jgi:hypothetical protein